MLINDTVDLCTTLADMRYEHKVQLPISSLSSPMFESSCRTKAFCTNFNKTFVKATKRSPVECYQVSKPKSTWKSDSASE